ncbi:MAG TPA: nuclear transport factor 2 family protein [Blastocatellia bacterium]|nr:nuclear transport factor 2 family protein [Blastocatellia bacterium]
MNPRIIGQIVLLCVLIGTTAPLVMAQKKANFSGVWKRTLGEELLTIEHREPRMHLVYWIRDISGERTLDLTAMTDGKEHRQTVLERPAIIVMRWEGAGLVWEINRETASGKIHNRRTLKLAADGNSMTAERVDIKPDGTEGTRFTETWVKAAPKSAADSKPEQELTQLANEFDEALRRGDTAFIEKHFAPDWLYTTLEGQTGKARAAIVAGLKSNTLKVEEWKTEAPQWQLYGDTALTSSIVTFKGQNNGQPVNARFRATSTFVKRDGRWQAISTQHTPILAPVEKSQAEQEVTKLHQDWLAALMRGDVEAVKRFLGDDYVAISETGVVRDKAQAIAEIKPPAASAPAVTVKPSSDGKIRFYGETAITTGGLSFSSSAGSQTLRYSTVAIKRQGQWQVVSSQVTIAKQ